MKNYNKNINYNDKWVLCRDYMTDDNYESIFVIAIKDGVIKYVRERNPNNVCYSDMNRFRNYAEFFINPIQMENPLLKGGNNVEDYKHPSIGSFRKINNEHIFPDNSSVSINDVLNDYNSLYWCN